MEDSVLLIGKGAFDIGYLSNEIGRKVVTAESIEGAAYERSRKKYSVVVIEPMLFAENGNGEMPRFLHGCRTDSGIPVILYTFVDSDDFLKTNLGLERGVHYDECIPKLGTQSIRFLKDGIDRLVNK